LEGKKWKAQYLVVGSIEGWASSRRDELGRFNRAHSARHYDQQGKTFVRRWWSQRAESEEYLFSERASLNSSDLKRKRQKPPHRLRAGREDGSQLIQPHLSIISPLSPSPLPPAPLLSTLCSLLALLCSALLCSALLCSALPPSPNSLTTGLWQLSLHQFHSRGPIGRFFPSRAVCCTVVHTPRQPHSIARYATLGHACDSLLHSLPFLLAPASSTLVTLGSSRTYCYYYYRYPSWPLVFFLRRRSSNVRWF
jgi:hypothetical protein